jgi:cytochrome b pre-mRNA-processing protein 3
MFADLDRSLREMGTGYLRVGREAKRMAQGFYGRIRAYENRSAADDSVLGPALRDPMTLYVRRAADDLRRQGADELLTGRVRFVSPKPCGPLPAARCR